MLEKNRGELLLEFQLNDKDLMGFLEQRGSMPLPPYIKRNDLSSNIADLKDYQSIFAEHEGAVAAPTASLHFTDRLVASLKKKYRHCISHTSRRSWNISSSKSKRYR